jgi:predicted transcriptional regulator
MKTAISLPDDLFRRADRLARKLGVSRSRLYRDAVAEYIGRRDPQSITTSLDDAVAEIGPELDRWSGEAARRTLERSEW